MPSQASPGGYEQEIPEDVTRLKIIVGGAKGGNGWYGNSGGNGGRAEGVYEVTEGKKQSLFIGVGANGGNGGREIDGRSQHRYHYGSNGGAGGGSPIDGGGGGGSGEFYDRGTAGYAVAPGGGGGGGASGVRIDGNLVVAAGGGGGGGGDGGAYDFSGGEGDGGGGGRGGGTVLGTEVGGTGGGVGTGKNAGDYATSGKGGGDGGVASVSEFDVESDGSSDRTDGFAAVRYLPPPPQNVTVSSIGRTVKLTWDGVPYADGYRILRDGSQVAEVGESPYSEEVVPDNTYTYKVVAYNSFGSTPSDQVTVEIPPPRVHIIGGDFLVAKVYDGQNWVETQTKQFDGSDWNE